MPSAELYLNTETLYVLSTNEESICVTDVDAATGIILKYNSTVYTYCWYMIVMDDEAVRWIIPKYSYTLHIHCWRCEYNCY